MTTLVSPTTRSTTTGRRLSRTACLPAVGQLVRNLRAAGVRPGDRVLLLGENDAGYLIAMLALIGLDASLVLADTRQTAAETDGVADRARVRWALLGGDDDLAPARRALVARLGADRVIPYDTAMTAVVPNAEGRPAGGPAPDAVTAGDAVGAFGAWCERRDAAVLWSSGTTGRPKGVVRSGRSLITNTLATMRVMGYRPDDVLFPLLPFSHQYGMSLVLIWWLTGCSLVVAPYRRLTDAVAAIAAHGVTTVDAAPPTYHALLGLLDRRPTALAGLHGVRLWCVGGAPLPAALATRFADTVGAPLLDGYGLSELGNVALTTVQNITGCGRPVPGVEVRIAALPAGPGDGGGTLGPDDRYGEIQVRSPGLLEGYLDEESRLLPVPRGWFGTGDLGRLDAAGNVHVVGRLRAVHRMGYTLYPESIQRQAEACGAPICLVSVDDERRGCQLVLFVEDPELRGTGYWRPRIDALLAGYERPNAIEVLPRLPVGATGKVDRAQLTQLAARRRGAVPPHREDT